MKAYNSPQVSPSGSTLHTSASLLTGSETDRAKLHGSARVLMLLFSNTELQQPMLAGAHTSTTKLVTPARVLVQLLVGLTVIRTWDWYVKKTPWKQSRKKVGYFCVCVVSLIMNPFFTNSCCGTGAMLL